MILENDIREKEQELRERYPTLYQALEILQEIRQNPMILHNYLREYLFENIEKGIFSAINEALDHHFESIDYLTEKNAYEIPVKILKFLNMSFGNEYPFFLGCVINRNEIPDHVFHYKPFSDFWMFCISKSWTRLVDTDPEVEKIREEIREKLRKNEILSEEYFEEIELNGGRGKFFWVCKEISDKENYCDDKKAQEIVNKLGMTVQKGDDLVEICISKTKIENLYCPTMFDNAFDNDYFRTYYRSDGWGETVNISPDAEEGYKGYPQAISRPVSIKEASICIIGCFCRNDDPADLGDLLEESCRELNESGGWQDGN